jgi:FkbM family methyltransferase
MKKIVKSLLQRVIKNRSIKTFLSNELLTETSLNEKSKFRVLNKLRADLVKDVFSYPSIVNNGYLHIERSIDILKARSIDKGLILDIGAASGETCILFSKAFPSVIVHGFEPIAKTFQLLSKNIESYKNIKVHHTALGSAKSTSKINIMSRITSSSLFQSEPNSNFNGENYFDTIGVEEINIEKLDSMINQNQNVMLIKMDVQGFELEVLKGAIETLKRTRFVLLEMQNHEIYIGAPKYYVLDEFLRNSDFELFEMIPSIREANQIKEFDAIYVNKALN